MHLSIHVYKHNSKFMQYFPIGELERFKAAKVTFKVTEGHWCRCCSI